MMKKILGIVFAGLTFSVLAFAHGYKSAYPYISKPTFVIFCDHYCCHKFNPSDVKKNDTIFVSNPGVFFQKFHSKIKFPYILVTSSDYPVPGKFEKYLSSRKLRAWFGRNMNPTHPKAFVLPIGISHQKGTKNPWVPLYATYARALKLCKAIKKDKLLYLNCIVHAPARLKYDFFFKFRKKNRQEVYNLFRHKSFCFVAKRKPLFEYLQDLSSSKFVLSPPGRGLDCFRTWEAMLMGSIPIVKSSIIDSLYEDLPVLIVKDWKDITEDFLIKKYEEMCKKEYKLEKLYADYWFDQINSQKNKSKKREKN